MNTGKRNSGQAIAEYMVLFGILSAAVLIIFASHKYKTGFFDKAQDTVNDFLEVISSDDFNKYDYSSSIDKFVDNSGG